MAARIAAGGGGGGGGGCGDGTEYMQATLLSLEEGWKSRDPNPDPSLTQTRT